MTSTHSNEKAMSDISKPKPFPLVWWLYFAIPYATMAFLATSWLNTPRWFPMVIALATTIATAQLVAVWSVYGPGSYFLRTFCASLLASIVIAGVVLGASSFTTRMPARAIHVAKAFAFLFPLLCCASTVPHWILRFGFGWQFVWRDAKPTPTFRLRELFAMTLVIALALAGVRLAASHYLGIFSDEMLAGSNNAFSTVAGSTPQEIRADMEKGTALGLLIYAAIISVCSVIYIPFLFLVFRSKNAKRAVIYCGATAFGGLLIANVANTMVTGFVAGLTGGFGILVGFLALSVSAFLVPLLYARTIGFSFLRNQGSIPSSQKLQPIQDSQ